MKTLFIISLVLLSLISSQSWSADFDKGTAAFFNGDFATALRELKSLAEQGDAVSQWKLGVMYYHGKGVIQDNVYAHMWFNLALSNKNAGELRDAMVKVWDGVAKRMTPSDISAAQNLARECIARNYKGC